MTTVHIPSLRAQLSGQANFIIWKRQVTNVLRVYDLLSVIDGSEKRPSNKGKENSETTTTGTSEAEEKELEDKWVKRDALVYVILDQNIEYGLALKLSTSSNSAEFWKQICDRFDHNMTVSPHKLLNRIINLKYNPGNSLVDHLNEFSQLWTALLERTACSPSTDKLGECLGNMAKETAVKASFLLSTLDHPDIEHVVDNLKSEGVTYEYIYEKLSDIASRKDTKGICSAYKGKELNGGPVGGQSSKNCPYCAKRGKPSGNHDYTECRRRTADKEKRKKKKTEDKAEAKVAGTAFYCPSDTNLATHDGQWIFGTGAAHHMAGIPPNTGKSRLAVDM